MTDIIGNRRASLSAFKLNEESKSVLRDILQSKDRDNKGYVTMDELSECLEAFGFSPDDDDLTFLESHLDDNGDGRLTVNEILHNIEVINYHCWYGKELMHEFKYIDKDNDGVIRFPEMLRYLTLDRENPLTVTAARQLLDTLARRYDANFDGKFSYSEFVRIYMSELLPFRTEIEQGTFKKSKDEVSVKPKSASPKKVIRKKTSPDISDTSRSESRSSSSSVKTSSATSTKNSPKPKTGQLPKTGTRPKTGTNSRNRLVTSNSHSTR